VIFRALLYTALTKTLAARDGWIERLWNARGKPEMFQFSCHLVKGGGGGSMLKARFSQGHICGNWETPTTPRPLRIWRTLIETLSITRHRKSPPTAMTTTHKLLCIFCPGTTSSPAVVGMWCRTFRDQRVEAAGTWSWLLLGPNRAQSKKEWSYVLNPLYRVSTKSFLDYKHLLQENYVEYKLFFSKFNSTQEVFFTTH
jgi:hypothetical protein